MKTLENGRLMTQSTFKPENGSAKVGHGSGVIISLRAA
jgi:hypothetical protein